MKNENNEYDFVIIGAGVAGLAAAMYGARLGMRTLCLGKSSGSEADIGGVITTTNMMENYPGFIKISGIELAEKIRKHAESYEKTTIKEEKVESIRKTEKGFIVKTQKNEYSGKTVLFATGAKWRRLEVPGAKELENKGVAYCALCDAPLFKNKTVAVLGGSDSAVIDALILAEHAKKVYIIYRKEKVRAEPTNLKAMESNKKIEIITNMNVTQVKGEKFVKAVVLDREHNGKKELELNGVFVAIGHIANSELAKELGIKLNAKNEIIINHQTCETNINGIYAAGDVTERDFKQAITGVAEGCTAAHSAFSHISKGKE